MLNWNPLVVYLDTTRFEGRNGEVLDKTLRKNSPVALLKKSLKGFLDWSISRREIKSILIVPYKTTLSNGYEFRQENDNATEVITIINWAMHNDPIYKKNHWLINKIKVIKIDDLTGINYHQEHFNLFMKLFPPDVILTGETTKVWREDNTSLVEATREKELVILFNELGNPESV
tara:strand:- start:69 stop:593 length:525 start_codon:yes stop_codon:yes gene_type:complete